MPIPRHGSERRPTPPLHAAQRVLAGLALSWVGWAAIPCAAAATTAAAVTRPHAAPASSGPPEPSAGWRRPVPGPAVRPFALGGDPFAAGWHRGVDLRAPAGRSVVSACAGVVVFAGRVPRHGRAVTVRCGRRRVSYLPLGSVAVRRGAAVTEGARLGTAGAGHAGALHVGVRDEARRGRYVDPEPLFGSAVSPPVTLLGPRGGARGPSGGIGPSTAPPGPAPRTVPPGTAPLDRHPDAGPPLFPEPTGTPWPVYLGLALLLAGARGGRAVARRRRAGRARRLAIRLEVRPHE